MWRLKCCLTPGMKKGRERYLNGKCNGRKLWGKPIYREELKFIARCKVKNQCVLLECHTNFLEPFVLLIIKNSERGSMKAPEHVSLWGCMLVTVLNLLCDRNVLAVISHLSNTWVLNSPPQRKAHVHVYKICMEWTLIESHVQWDFPTTRNWKKIF